MPKQKKLLNIKSIPVTLSSEQAKQISQELKLPPNSEEAEFFIESLNNKLSQNYAASGEKNIKKASKTAVQALKDFHDTIEKAQRILLNFDDNTINSINDDLGWRLPMYLNPDSEIPLNSEPISSFEVLSTLKEATRSHAIMVNRYSHSNIHLYKARALYDSWRWHNLPTPIDRDWERGNWLRI